MLRAEVFWTNRTDIHDHEALYEPHTNDLRTGIQKFHEIRYTIPVNMCKNWKIIPADNGENVYELSACVVTQMKGDLVRFGFRVLPSGTELLDDEQKIILWEEDEFSVIFDKKFSHVPQEADPAAFAPTLIRRKSGSFFVRDDSVVEDTEHSEPIVRKSSTEAAI